MNPFRLVNYLWPALVSMMVLSTIVASLPAVLANDTPDATVEEVQVSEGSTQRSPDLEALAPDNQPQWSWEIDESDGIISENLESNIESNTLDDSPSVNSEPENQDWDHRRRGDPKEGKADIPLAEF